MTKEKSIRQLLRRLGATGTYVGFEYVVYCTSLAIENRTAIQYVTKGVYVDAAKRFRTSVKCVERNIRTVITLIWEHGDRELLDDIAGRTLAERPKGSAFIDMLADYVTRQGEEEDQLEKKMDKIV